MSPRAAEPQDGAGPPIRDAATIVLLRTDGAAPRVLMGQRGAGAIFMPDKFVFPGGAVDPGDIGFFDGEPEDRETRWRLAARSGPEIARALPFTAVRELWEETGILLGRPGSPPAGRPVPAAWQGFIDHGLLPDVAPLRLIFRAVTPPRRPRRFDARFFLVRAGEAHLAADALSGGDGELAHLQWLEIPEARRLPLPFITEVVLSELEAALVAPDGPQRVPFFDHSPDGAHFRML